MEGERHALHCIGEVSKLLAGQETNTITRNATRYIIREVLLCSTLAVCNFQPMKSPMELNSLFSKLFCYITCFVLSPD